MEPAITLVCAEQSVLITEQFTLKMLKNLNKYQYFNDFITKHINNYLFYTNNSNLIINLFDSLLNSRKQELLSYEAKNCIITLCEKMSFSTALYIFLKNDFSCSFGLFETYFINLEYDNKNLVFKNQLIKLDTIENLQMFLDGFFNSLNTFYSYLHFGGEIKEVKKVNNLKLEDVIESYFCFGEKDKLFNIQDVKLIEENDWNNKLNKILKDMIFCNVSLYLNDNNYIDIYSSDKLSMRTLYLDSISHKGLAEKILLYTKAEPIKTFIVEYNGPLYLTSGFLKFDTLLLEYEDRYIVLWFYSFD